LKRDNQEQDAAMIQEAIKAAGLAGHGGADKLIIGPDRKRDEVGAAYAKAA
jgi:hypothetical protein